MDRYEWCGVEPGSLEKYFNRKPCKVIKMTGEPDYGVGDFRRM